MKIEEVELFIKEHNIPSPKHAWVLYMETPYGSLRNKFWDAYVFMRDGNKYKPTLYGFSDQIDSYEKNYDKND